jgi:hypothetical protein
MKFHLTFIYLFLTTLSFGQGSNKCIGTGVIYPVFSNYTDKYEKINDPSQNIYIVQSNLTNENLYDLIFNEIDTSLHYELTAVLKNSYGSEVYKKTMTKDMLKNLYLTNFEDKPKNLIVRINLSDSGYESLIDADDPLNLYLVNCKNEYVFGVKSPLKLYFEPRK